MLCAECWPICVWFFSDNVELAVVALLYLCCLLQKNSSSSRGSSPYRHHPRMTHLAVVQTDKKTSSTTRKFSSRKSLAKSPHLQARPDHLKLEACSNRQYHQESTLNHVTVPRPTITLSKPAAVDEHASIAESIHSDSNEPSFETSYHNSTLTSEHRTLAPGQTDACIQTEENEVLNLKACHTVDWYNNTTGQISKNDE